MQACWRMLQAMAGQEDSQGIDVQNDISRYNSMHDDKKMDSDGRTSNYAEVVNTYYNLATDFYEWGWGQSFHFANKLAGESFASSIFRHEYYLALRLGIEPSHKVLDCGCGIGGPARNIARFTRAQVTGITINPEGNALFVTEASTNSIYRIAPVL